MRKQLGKACLHSYFTIYCSSFPQDSLCTKLKTIHYVSLLYSIATISATENLVGQISGF